ncbi:histone-lysine N-methyltransferase ATXR2 isoform X2 [Cucumis melo var. makuwa]|uniref:Histone-lysine N-methyltransferase ATXR2 isoform X2 n=1 Tax=Cucumis melo var. makuwa TaxID=1194695 RepID=A0A5D3BGZ6_CUCMM|nr:histone-lysine N-methyltransferase ATXR2 isoform X2 [Cucumis melo var. makuwa]
MASVCPIDSKYPNEISALLSPPSPHQVQEYFDQLVWTRQCRGLRVKQNGAFGKGVFADTVFREGDLVLKDQMLVGSQHTSNKMDCLVCSFCFRFVGSIELQIGRKLYFQDLGVSTNHQCDMEPSSPISEDCMETESDDGQEIELENNESMGACSSSTSKGTDLPKGLVESLMNGGLSLPHSNEFAMPPAIPCPGGCGEAFYCSKSCAEADWEVFHSLLCTGGKTEPSRREAMLKFIQHANDTNDIFLLAAKAISSTILKYKKLKLASSGQQTKYGTCPILNNADLSILLEAWKPISMGHKRRWWDCIALPDDVEPSNEVAFRMQIREMAFMSLQLLKEAIFDVGCEPLFSLEIYGRIIGMFELNNLDLVVASPVEDYFLYIDELSSPHKERAEEITRPLLDALGDSYSICCQGTAFFPLQSCMNHSCYPNAKAFKREEDRDGQATIIAVRPIHPGEETKIYRLVRDEHYLQIMGSNAGAPSAYKSILSKPFPLESASSIKFQTSWAN